MALTSRSTLEEVHADLIFVRQNLRAEALGAGLGLVDQTKLITAGSELVRNILTYARGTRSEIQVEQVRTVERRGVRATFRDEGPGSTMSTWPSPMGTRRRAASGSASGDRAGWWTRWRSQPSRAPAPRS